MYSQQTKAFFVFFCLSGFILLLNAILNPTIAQEAKGSIKGKVIDSKNNDELIGANIFISAIDLGASTNLYGEYRIDNIPSGNYTITVSYVGYKETKRDIIIEPNKMLTLNIDLQPTTLMLSELIVTGQGSAIERKKLTANVESIKSEDIKYVPIESVDQLLQGRVPGLNSFNSSGMPGTSGRVSTRGVKSTVTSTTPVIYIDGVRVDNNDAFRLRLDTGGAESSALADLVVGEIDRVEVIKGGAASTLYGSEASNGVIQIFTKKGVPGIPKWSFNFTSGFDEAEKKFMSSDFAKNNLFQSGYYQSYKAAVTGGSSAFTYNLSTQMFQNNGVIKEDQNNNKNYNLNTGFRVVLTPEMNLEISASYTKNKFNRIFNNNTSGSPFSDFESGTYDIGYTDGERDSLLKIMLTPKINDDVDRFRIAVNFDYSPYKFWTNKFTVGTDYRKNEERIFVSKGIGDFFGTENGWLERADREYQTITISYTGTLILPKLYNIEQTLNFGLQGFRVDDREEYAKGEGFSIPGTEDFDNASVISALESSRQLFNGGFFLSDQISVYDKLFFDLGFRLDGNSTFGDAIGMQFYPKAGVAYLVSQEPFFPDILRVAISSLKLRGAWGLTGNFPTPFTRDRSYGAQAFLGSTGITFNPGGNPGNDELKPEKTSSIDVGFDLGLFNDRVSLEVNYFNQLTRDALFLVPKDPASGFNTQLTNVGKIENKGIELSLFAQIIQEENISLDTKISYSTLENKVISLGGSSPFSLASFTFLPRRVEEGYPVGVFQVNVPTGDGTYKTELVGNPLPTNFGSFSLNLTLFKNLTISALTEFAFGHQFVNLKNVLRYFNGTEDTQTIVPDGYSFQTASNVWLEDADWIKLREIALIYRIPENIFKGVTLNASVRNVAVFGVDTNADPELNGYQPSGPNTGGYNFGDLSAPRQFRFGVNVNL
ncbi:MAG TPA: TonB-dependent receptor [Melioribacteraceae bacterium]|nr:TonB-dependent receptor [Melioribacteraceae bacterium]